jgi:hypothetical protein
MASKSFGEFGKFGAARRGRGWPTWLALCLALCRLGVGLPAYGQQGTFITFDAPGAGTGAGQGTYPVNINPAGVVAGWYIDANEVAHGFLRASDDTISTFDAPGAGTSAFEGTYVHAINSAGVITGDYYDANFVDHGFVRASEGTFTTFDVAGALFFNSVGGIDPARAVTGTYADTNFVAHGFFRSPGGAISTIDAPGAFTTPGYGLGTQAFGIDPRGAVAGCYTDSNSVGHGFVRASNGALTTFNFPDPAIYFAGCSFDYGWFFSGIPLVGINPSGAITGSYFQPISGNPFTGNYRGFLRAKDGSFTTFDAVPSPSLPCCTWTFGIAINPAGTVAGYDNDYNSVNHGFVRPSNGTVTILDAPGAGTGFNQGTWPFSINPAGQVAGVYRDANNVFHGFLWIPPSQ